MQKAHVQQFVVTEDALNKAAEAKTLCQKILKRLHGSHDALQMLPTGGTTSNLGSTRNFEVLTIEVLSTMVPILQKFFSITWCLLIPLFVMFLLDKYERVVFGGVI